MSDEPTNEGVEQKNPLQEITQPFIDLFHAPRALWGINLAYLIEGMVYFGIVSYLAMYFNEYVGLNDVWAGWMVMVMTAGITISMFFFGGLADRWGVRIAILGAFCLMIIGRTMLSAGPSLGLGSGIGSPLQLFAVGGILLVVLGYGMYQPAAYAAIRQFTTPKTAAMGLCDAIRPDEPRRLVANVRIPDSKQRKRTWVGDIRHLLGIHVVHRAGADIDVSDPVTSYGCKGHC